MALTVSVNMRARDAAVTLNSDGLAEVGLGIREDQEREGVVEQKRNDKQRDVAHRLASARALPAKQPRPASRKR